MCAFVISVYSQVRGKTMADKAEDMMELFLEVLQTTDFDDQDRFLQMVLETKAAMEAAVVGSGHSIAASRLSAQNSIAGESCSRACKAGKNRVQLLQ